MPIPFLETLSRSARLAYPVVQRGVREGLSANRIQTALQEAGLGIRRATLLEMIRREANVERLGGVLRFLRPELRPDPARLPEALTKTLRQFSFKVRVRGVDIVTGDVREFFISVASDDLLSRQEIESRAATLVDVDPERYPVDLEEVQLMEGVRSGTFGTLL